MNLGCKTVNYSQPENTEQTGLAIFPAREKAGVSREESEDRGSQGPRARGVGGIGKTSKKKRKGGSMRS